MDVKVKEKFEKTREVKTLIIASILKYLYSYTCISINDRVRKNTHIIVKMSLVFSL